MKKTPKTFNKSKLYGVFFNYIKKNKLMQFPALEISNIFDKNLKFKSKQLYVVKVLSDSIKEYYKDILELEKNDKVVDRLILEIKIDVCKRFLEDYTSYINTNFDDKSVINISNDIENFKYYPELTDTAFNQKIYNKKRI